MECYLIEYNDLDSECPAEIFRKITYVRNLSEAIRDFTSHNRNIKIQNIYKQL